jgi:hypothetical protein
MIFNHGITSRCDEHTDPAWPERILRRACTERFCAGRSAPPPQARPAQAGISLSSVPTQMQNFPLRMSRTAESSFRGTATPGCAARLSPQERRDSPTIVSLKRREVLLSSLQMSLHVRSVRRECVDDFYVVTTTVGQQRAGMPDTSVRKTC